MNAIEINYRAESHKNQNYVYAIFTDRGVRYTVCISSYDWDENRITVYTKRKAYSGHGSVNVYTKQAFIEKYRNKNAESIISKMVSLLDSQNESEGHRAPRDVKK
ncbi:MAG: hypothetical protein GWN62_16955 [Aliifodinibius sp.]|nr:hypothetical protein [Fodinibius sp.]